MSPVRSIRKGNSSSKRKKCRKNPSLKILPFFALLQHQPSHSHQHSHYLCKFQQQFAFHRFTRSRIIHVHIANASPITIRKRHLNILLLSNLRLYGNDERRKKCASKVARAKVTEMTEADAIIVSQFGFAEHSLFHLLLMLLLERECQSDRITIRSLVLNGTRIAVLNTTKGKRNKEREVSNQNEQKTHTDP